MNDTNYPALAGNLAAIINLASVPVKMIKDEVLYLMQKTGCEDPIIESYFDNVIADIGRLESLIEEGQEKWQNVHRRESQ